MCCTVERFSCSYEYWCILCTAAIEHTQSGAWQSAQESQVCLGKTSQQNGIICCLEISAYKLFAIQSLFTQCSLRVCVVSGIISITTWLLQCSGNQSVGLPGFNVCDISSDCWRVNSFSLLCYCDTWNQKLLTNSVYTLCIRLVQMKTIIVTAFRATCE